VHRGKKRGPSFLKRRRGEKKCLDFAQKGGGKDQRESSKRKAAKRIGGRKGFALLLSCRQKRGVENAAKDDGVIFRRGGDFSVKTWVKKNKNGRKTRLFQKRGEKHLKEKRETKSNRPLYP